MIARFQSFVDRQGQGDIIAWFGEVLEHLPFVDRADGGFGGGMSGQDNPHDVRGMFRDPGKQVSSGHAGHAFVGDDEIDGGSFEDVDGLFARPRGE